MWSKEKDKTHQSTILCFASFQIILFLWFPILSISSLNLQSHPSIPIPWNYLTEEFLVSIMSERRKNCRKGKNKKSKWRHCGAEPLITGQGEHRCDASEHPQSNPVTLWPHWWRHRARPLFIGTWPLLAIIYPLFPFFKSFLFVFLHHNHYQWF